MTDHRTIHRFIPAGPRNEAKTACGIRISSGPMAIDGTAINDASDGYGGVVAVVLKGQPFDCKRCQAVIEQFRKGRITA